jgi:hypothetical protein
MVLMIMNPKLTPGDLNHALKISLPGTKMMPISKIKPRSLKSRLKRAGTF